MPSSATPGQRGFTRLQALRGRGRPSWAGVAWWLPALYALWLGLSRLPPKTEPLLSDAQDYFDRARYFQPELWVTGDTREPLWGLANSFVLEVFGESPTTLRVSSLVVFVALVVAAQYLAREVVGTWLAIAVGAVLASSEYLVQQATTGLREEAAALAAVLVALAVLHFRPGWRWPLLLGLLAACGAMIRWDTLILTLPVIAWALWRHRVPLPKLGGAMALFAVIVVPFCVGNAIEFGDPLHHSNVHSTFFRNLDLAGQPGYPTKEEVAADAFADPDETWASYLFEDHDVGWVIDRTWEGTFNTALRTWSLTVLGPTQPGPQWGFVTTTITAAPTTFVPWLLLALTAGGFVVLVRRPRGWPIAAMLVLALVQHAPIQHLMDPRLGLATIPFMAIAVAAALSGLWSRFVAAAARTASHRPAA